MERLTRLLEELLLLARLDAGPERAISKAVSLNQLAQEAAERLEPLARERQIQITLEPSPSMTARIARAPAGLVLVNLMDNAVKFSPTGGRVSVLLTIEGPEAVMSVRDTGPGIRPGELPHLFERFYRGSAARTGSAPGFGLGLALSQAIVKAHGGRIDVSNLPGGGALFAVRLPLAA